MTKEQALGLQVGDEVHWGNCARTIGPRGGTKEKTMVCRVSGKPQIKKRAGTWRVPVKRGLYDSGELSDSTVSQFHLPEDCPLNESGPVSVSDSPCVARVQPVLFPILHRPFFRVVCSCGFTTKEKLHRSEAEAELAQHTR